MRTLHTASVFGLSIALALTLTQAARAQNPGTPAAVVTVTATPVVGSEAVRVSGTAPPGRTVQLTLSATFSRDMPDVVITRKTVVADGSGAFATTAQVAPGYFRGAVVTVVASTSPSGPSATARYTIGAPNVTVPPDNLPHSVQ